MLWKMSASVPANPSMWLYLTISHPRSPSIRPATMVTAAANVNPAVTGIYMKSITKGDDDVVEQEEAEV